MSLKITKDRSNIDNFELEETVEVFIENINKGIKSFDSLSASANSTKDTLYTWDSSYKEYNKIMNDIVYSEDYNSWYE